MLESPSNKSSHVAALSPEPLGVDPGDEVEGVHVAVHAHRNAFLNDRCRGERISRTLMRRELRASTNLSHLYLTLS